MLVGLAVLPAALPATPACAEVDPVYAAIEHFRQLSDEHSAAVERSAPLHPEDPGYWDAEDATADACDALFEQMDVLFNFRPSTVAGTAALLKYISELEEWQMPPGLEEGDGIKAVQALCASLAAALEQIGRGCVMAEIFKFPYDACHRVHSRKPRRSKNGTPEERAAKAAAELVPAEIVNLSTMRAEAPADKVDRRKLRGNPLRESYALISPAVTIVGKIYTAKLRQDDWWDVAMTENWLQTLEAGATAARHVADELEKQAKSISLTAKYEALPLEEKQIISAEVDRLLRSQAQSENSDSPVNLPVLLWDNLS